MADTWYHVGLTGILKKCVEWEEVTLVSLLQRRTGQQGVNVSATVVARL